LEQVRALAQVLEQARVPELAQVPEQARVPEQAQVPERAQVPEQVQVQVRGQVPEQAQVPEQVLERARVQVQVQVPGSVSSAATTQLPWNCITGRGRSTSRLTTPAFQRFPVQMSSTPTRLMRTATTRSSNGRPMIGIRRSAFGRFPTIPN
jgi:hypothetical protein